MGQTILEHVMLGKAILSRPISVMQGELNLRAHHLKKKISLLHGKLCYPILEHALSHVVQAILCHMISEQECLGHSVTSQLSTILQILNE